MLTVTYNNLTIQGDSVNQFRQFFFRYVVVLYKIILSVYADIVKLMNQFSGPVGCLIILQSPVSLMLIVSTILHQSHAHPMTMFMSYFLAAFFIPMSIFTFLTAQVVSDQVLYAFLNSTACNLKRNF